MTGVLIFIAGFVAGWLYWWLGPGSGWVVDKLYNWEAQKVKDYLDIPGDRSLAARWVYWRWSR